VLNYENHELTYIMILSMSSCIMQPFRFKSISCKWIESSQWNKNEEKNVNKVWKVQCKI